MAVLLLIIPVTTACAEEDYRYYYNDLYESSGAEALEDALPDDARSLMDELGFDMLSGDLSSKGMMQIIGEIFADSFSSSGKFIFICCAIIILYAVFAGIGGEENLAAEYISLLAVAGGCIVPAVSLIKDASTAIEGVGGFMLTFIPVFAGILIAGGSVTAAGGFSGMLLFAAEGVSTVISGAVVPFISMFSALSVSSACTPLKIGKTVESLKKISTWLLTLALTLFTGILGLQTAISSAADNTALRTARFMAGSFLPVVGSAVGEVLGTVTGCVGMLRSTAGVYGILGVLFIIFPVFAQLVAWRVSLMLCEALADLFSADRIGALLRSVGSAISLLMGIVAFSALLFILSLTIVMQAGGKV